MKEIKAYRLMAMLYDPETEDSYESCFAVFKDIEEAPKLIREYVKNSDYFYSFDWKYLDDIIHHFELVELRPDPEMYDTIQPYARVNMEIVRNENPTDLENYKY